MIIISKNVMSINFPLFANIVPLGMTSSVLTDPASAARLSMSYLGVAARGERGEACANGVSGGDSASTGSDSMVSGASGRPSSNAEETTTQRQRSVLLSPNMELERARAKIRLLQKEVRKINQFPNFHFLISISLSEVFC